MKLLTFCLTWRVLSISATCLSMYWQRVQSRIATLTTSTATIRQTSAREHTDPWASSGNASPDPSPSGNASPDPSRPGLVPGNRSETQTTLSERVQDLDNTNDPWEAREWGRPDGPYPSTEGMLFAPMKVRLACIMCSMDLLPCRSLGGPGWVRPFQ